MGVARTSADVRLLVDQHYKMLYRYAYRLSGSTADAEDLTQETFCTAQAKIGQLRDSRSARAWLCRILRNHYLQSRRSHPAVLVESLDHLVAEPMQKTDSLVEVDAERLQVALSELPEPFRTPLILFYFEAFSYRQIAEQMEQPIGTVMSRLARAKAYLRARLQAAYVPDAASATPGVS